MATGISRATWVQLYKNLQREAAKVPDFNYRSFAQRRVRDHFEKNRGVTDTAKQQALFTEGQRNLEILRRQAIIGGLYPHQHTVVEEQVAQQKAALH